jgi:hypothetical protein
MKYLFKGANRNMQKWAAQNVIMLIIIIVVSLIAFIYQLLKSL